MEHIVQLGINIDDNAIRKAVENDAKKQIIASIEEGVMESLFSTKYYGGKPSPKDGFNYHGEQIMMNWLEKHQEEIINATAKLFAEKLAKRKAGREAIQRAEAIQRTQED